MRNGRGISSLKVPWRKDPALDSAIKNDTTITLCSRLVRSLLLAPNQSLPLRYLNKRRERLRLPHNLPFYLSRYPTLFEQFPSRLKPNAPLVPFLRPSPHLLSFLAYKAHLHSLHQPLLVSKLCKLLMMSTHRVISADKLFDVKRAFGFPDDFLETIVPQYPHYFRLLPGEGKSYLELVDWNEDYAKSVVELEAEKQSELTGVPMRPNFNGRLPRGVRLRKEMREWLFDWLELPYVSPYADASRMDTASVEMEKRNVALLHEVLSLTVLKRMEVPVIGKFWEEFRLSNAFTKVFTRHPGLFYVSLKGGIKTAMLREAYNREGELVDRDPLLEIKDKFAELLEDGHKEWKEKEREKREAIEKEKERAKRESVEKENEMAAKQGAGLCDDECCADV